MMGYGPGLGGWGGTAGIFMLATWVVWFFVGVLLLIWLWREITKK